MANFTILFCIATLLIFTVVASSTFRLESFCASRCSRGRGGNLCRCNGFHFAGKRSQKTRSPSDDFSIWGFQTELTDDDKIEDKNLEETEEDNEYSSEENTESTDDKLQKFQSILENILTQSLGSKSRHAERSRHRDLI